MAANAHATTIEVPAQRKVAQGLLGVLQHAAEASTHFENTTMLTGLTRGSVSFQQPHTPQSVWTGTFEGQCEALNTAFLQARPTGVARPA
jgi:hypothetical protein